MSAKFTLEGSGGGAVKAVQDLNKALDEAEKKSDGAAKASKRLQDAAKRVAESVDPQTKYNNRIAELAQLVTKAGLSTEHAAEKARQYRAQLEGVGVAGEKAFGAQAVASIGRYLAGFLSVGAAIGAATSALRENAAQRERAAQRAMQSRAGLGSLSQLAATQGNTSEERTAAFRSLVDEARGYVASGAAADENEAGNLVFELAGADLNERDRAFAAQLRAAGTLTNVGGAAQAYDALKTALGAEEVGTFSQFASKGLQAASVAPGSFEQLPIAAAGAGGSAKKLGVSDEFLLAATAIVGKTLGSVDEGGTQVAALLKQIEKSGMKVDGLGGVGIIEKIAALPEKQQGFGGVLGDRAEAVSGFRVLRDNLEALKQLEQSTAAAQSNNLAGEAAKLSESDDVLSNARARARAEGELQTVQTANSARTNLIAALRAERRAAIQADGSGVYFRGALEAVEDYFNTDAEIQRSWQQVQESRAAGYTDGFSPETVKMLEEYMRRTAEGIEKLDGGSRSRATTRPE